MMFRNVGIIEDWRKKPREALHEKTLLVIGLGNIGKKVLTVCKTL